MADRRLWLPEVVDPQHRLGRNVNHDYRSLAYQIPKATTPESVKWDRRIPVDDQSKPISLGRCVPTSAVGLFGTEPYYSLLEPQWRDRLNATLATEWYREVTRIDPFPGEWEPHDTGSDGLSIAKLVHGKGLISGYQHITSLEAAWAAIKNGPFITGLMWLAGMDRPNAEGIVSATGAARGGHEFEIAEYDASRGLWWCWNSWGSDWGKGGKFALTDEDYAKLLGMQGDATVFVPNTQPAPQPQPIPNAEDAFKNFPFAPIDAWAAAKRPWWTKRNRIAAEAYDAWRATVRN